MSRTPDGLARDRHGILERKVRDGDGTVPYNSALPGTDGQNGHAGATAWADRQIERINRLRPDRAARGDPAAPRLGDGEIGIDLPDLVFRSTRRSPSRSAGSDGPTNATVVVRDEDGLTVDHPTVFYGDGSYRARFGPLSEGIYQVKVEGSGESAVSQRVLVTDA